MNRSPRSARGGGGEVWAVRDRITGRTVALKALGENADEREVLALVREAVALSGVEGSASRACCASAGSRSSMGARRERRRAIVPRARARRGQEPGRAHRDGGRHARLRQRHRAGRRSAHAAPSRAAPPRRRQAGEHHRRRRRARDARRSRAGHGLARGRGQAEGSRRATPRPSSSRAPRSRCAPRSTRSGSRSARRSGPAVITSRAR